MTLMRTWVALVALSGLTTALAAYGPARPVLVCGVLLLAGAKARLILNHYLDLQSAPAWSKGFTLTLAALLAAFATLSLLA